MEFFRRLALAVNSVSSVSMKTVWIFVALLALSAPLFPAEPAGIQPGATNVVRLTPAIINELAEAMRTNHPALRALDARVRAASHVTNAVRTWEDPVAKFGGFVASDRGPVLKEEGDLIYGVDEKLPLFGKAQAARRVAQAEADAAIARQSMQFQILRRDLAKALFKTAYEEQMIEAGREDFAWLDTMTAATEERYRAGGATQVDVLRLQNERMNGALLPSAAEFSKCYGLTAEKLAFAKRDAIVMHPGPMNRGVEIDSSVADGGQSVILPQVTFGIAVRMAVMSLLGSP